MDDSLSGAPEGRRRDLAVWILRFGLLATAVLGWTGAGRVWEVGDTVGDGRSLALMLLTWLASFAVLGLAVLGRPPARSGWAIPAVLLLVFADYAWSHHVHHRAHGPVVTTDVFLYNDYAARLVRHGENPYRHDLRGSYEIHRAVREYATPLVDADITGRLPYPALSPLLFVPFQALGIPTSWVYPLFFVLAAAALWWCSPAEVRPVVLLPLFVEERFMLYSLGGVSDVVWAFMLLMVVASWRSRAGRGLWFGLACAFKQTPWLLAPFFLVRLWHETGGGGRRRLREMALFAAWSAAAFLAVDLPFIVLDAGAWWRGVLEPLVADMIPFGQGLAALTTSGYAVVPKAWASLFTWGALGIGLWIYGRHWHRLRDLLWIAPGLALWLGNRSLSSYWYYGAIPLALALAKSWAEGGGEEPERRPDWRTTALVASAFLVFVGASVLRFAVAPEPFEVRLRPPVATYGEWAHELELEVRNRSAETVRPRVAVQSWTNQPFFWTVGHGPSALAPDEAATYRVHTEVPFEMFLARHGARVTVADAATLSSRTTVEIEQETSYAFPGVVPNGRFRFWTEDPNRPGPKRPLGWRRASADDGAATVEYDKDGGGLLRFALAGAPDEHWHTVRLETTLMFPEDPVTFHVKPPREANRLPDPDFLYGLELESGRDRLVLLFGGTPGAGDLEPGLPFRTLAAPPETWSAVTVDFKEVFAEAGIEIRPLRYKAHAFPLFEFPNTPLVLRLYVAARRREGGVEARFGEVRSADLRTDPERLFDRDLAHPERWLMWRGDVHFEARNFELARELYLEAVVLDPDFAPAHYRLAEAELWRGRWEAAAAAYEKSLELGFEAANATKGLAWCRFNSGRIDDALELFERALELFEAEDDPDDALHRADCHKGRWLVFLRRGECAAAGLARSEALALAPEMPLAAPEEENCPV